MPSKKNSNLVKRGFLSKVTTLVGGTILSQLVMMSLSPFLTRLYTPDEYGYLAIFLAVVGILVVNSSLRYQLAIPLGSNKQIQLDITFLSICLVLITTVFYSIVIFFFGDAIADVLNLNNAPPSFFLLLIASVSFLGLNQVFLNYNIANDEYKIIAISKIFQAASVVFFQLCFYSYGVFALISAQVIAHFISLTILISRFRVVFALRLFDFSRLGNVARENVRYPKFESFSSLLNVAGGYLPILLLGFFFSPSSVGQFALTTQVLTSPIGILSDAISKVFIGGANECIKSGLLKRRIINIIRVVFCLGFPLLLIIMMFGREIFVFIFGPSWAQAGVFAIILSPWLFLVSIVTCISGVLLIYDRQRITLIFQAVLFILRLIAIYFGFLVGDVYTSVCLFSAVSFLCWLFYFVYILDVSSVRFKYLFLKDSEL